MSVKGSLSFYAVGTYSKGTECLWHVWQHCTDHTYHLEVTLFSHALFEIEIPAWLMRVLP